jgi:hypothetical protein
MKKIGFKDGFFAGLGYFASQLLIGVIFLLALLLVGYLVSCSTIQNHIKECQSTCGDIRK